MTQTPERTYDCGTQLLHQLDGSFHCAAGLNPLVNQQNLHTCRETIIASVHKTKYIKKTVGFLVCFINSIYCVIEVETN